VSPAVERASAATVRSITRRGEKSGLENIIPDFASVA
jgi:hypothetical protein